MIYFVLVVVIGVLITTIWNLNRKYNRLENELLDTEKSCYKVVANLLVTYTAAAAELDRVDKRGGFASDDEVGFTFKIIQKTITELATYLNNLQKQINGEEEGEKK